MINDIKDIQRDCPVNLWILLNSIKLNHQSFYNRLIQTNLDYRIFKKDKKTLAIITRMRFRLDVMLKTKVWN